MYAARYWFAGPVLAAALCAVVLVSGVPQATADPIVANLQAVVGAPDLLRDPQSYTLAQIINAGGIIIGDKLFDSFDVTTTKSLDAIASGPAEIAITPIQVLKPNAPFGGDYGFKVNGAWSAPAGEFADSTIEFRATILPEFASRGVAFKDNALWLTAFGVEDTINAGGVSISENLYGAHPSSGDLPFANEFVYYRNNTDNTLRDAATFAPVTQLWVVKDLLVYEREGAGGAAHISEFYQTFSQQVPEPGTLALLGLAGLGLVVQMWRKRRECQVRRFSSPHGLARWAGC